eukprot:gnl/MRDRNA2_/MRDRNA2_113436_c0_seq1.p1 gnl/MRDRNA2_/MRDRNA2_113436_c0~~gnl/MRDRNA2_/MRDRNA2_113436_c0_seq1.p1  ORF type:complete len:544 (+),score=107.79 gnl/MRDRNA2_/MRDRNA2_113436_c0_seq1:125-1633(+)
MALGSHVVFLILAVVQAQKDPKASVSGSSSQTRVAGRFLPESSDQARSTSLSEAVSQAYNRAKDALQKVSGQGATKDISSTSATKGRFFKDETLSGFGNQKPQNGKGLGKTHNTVDIQDSDFAKDENETTKPAQKFETSLTLKDPFTSKNHEASLLEKPETLHQDIISGIQKGMKALGIDVETPSVMVTSLQLSRDLMKSQQPSLALQYEVSDVDGCKFGDLIHNKAQRRKFEDAFMTRWAEQQAGGEPFSVKFRIEPSLNVRTSTNCPASLSEVNRTDSSSASRAHVSHGTAQQSGGDKLHGYRPPLVEPSLVTMMDIRGDMDRSDEGAVLHYDDSFQQALRASIAHGFWEVQNYENQHRAAHEKKNYAPAAFSDVRLLRTNMRVYDRFNVRASANGEQPLLTVQYQLLHMDDPKALEILRILEDTDLKKRFQDEFGKKFSDEYAALRGMKPAPTLTVMQSRLALDPHLKAPQPTVQTLGRNKQIADIQANPALGFNHMKA